MPVMLFCRTLAEQNAEVNISKFYEGLEFEIDKDTISVLEFIIHVKDESPIYLSKLDIVVANFLSEVKDQTSTFKNINLYDNQAYTQKLEVLDETKNKYCIDGIIAHLACLSSPPSLDAKKGAYSTIRLNFDKINPGDSKAFRLKITIPNFGTFYNSLGIFELSVYYPAILPKHLETMKEWGLIGIPIDRKLCEIWVILPGDTIFRRAFPKPQQIKINHMYHLLSANKINPPRHAIYWDLEDAVFDMPGRDLGDYIAPSKGVRIYCETTKPHVTPETFEAKMGTALDGLKDIQGRTEEAAGSLNFIAKYGKQSFILTLFMGLIAILISVIL